VCLCVWIDGQPSRHSIFAPADLFSLNIVHLLQWALRAKRSTHQSINQSFICLNTEISKKNNTNKQWNSDKQDTRTAVE